ncbi:predicted protein [Plenodomus lingam JN3]|uniref:Predicted protein n=1 Tax=Leptosphaeria maculans (strain JN3 / isolate v23.1.3 / race Av1-4-5-6-7-8) TaxID=985895 RepID=E5A1T8_LEPMJ|nr:predicted protein [Plenodomus lingam JN3]CBX97655.1 predicted protein [Plenodomus lingam JN3]
MMKPRRIVGRTIYRIFSQDFQTHEKALYPANTTDSSLSTSQGSVVWNPGPLRVELHMPRAIKTNN